MELPAYEIVLKDDREFIRQNRFPYLFIHVLYINSPMTNWVDFNITKSGGVQIAGYKIYLESSKKRLPLSPRLPVTIKDELGHAADWYLREIISKDLEKYKPFAL
jgi:hypothetical protein